MTARDQALARATAAATPIAITFHVLPAHAPALKSHLDDVQELLGKKLEGAAPFATEEAWTAAAVAMGALRAAVNAKVQEGDPHYA